MNKKAAIEMSMTTFVTIVLVVIVMVLGIFFVQRIFSSGTNAIDSIDSQVQSEINKLFAAEGGILAVYPTSQKFNIVRGDDPKGFAFSVRNDDGQNARDFSYSVIAQDVSSCGVSMTKEKAENFIRGRDGTFSLGAGRSHDLSEIVLFEIPESAPACTLTYYLGIERDSESYTGARIFVTIK